MLNSLPSSYSYKVGGSLAFNHPTYVEREADRHLLTALQAGKFCYVFNSRQMGKSSLRVRAVHQLQAQGMSCASIDITSLGSDVSPQQWYSGMMAQLFLGFNLAGKVNLKAWLREREELPPVQRLGQFLEEIVLGHCLGEKIFIFIDEIDKVLSLDFSLDDFFSLIRFCYNQRAENLQYERLTFALFGVATPSDLIREKTQTSFNIGQAIELTGFSETEVEPLEKGLISLCETPQTVLREILSWTGGQPFLTQKLCQLLIATDAPIPAGKEAARVKELVKTKIIDDWESQDEPVHLKTIRDRLLRNEQRAGRLLGLYQQILRQGAIEADDSPEQSELRLSGLIVKRQGKLQAYNPIYQGVFNEQWVNRELEKLRPYAQAIAAWEVSGERDDSRLLRGQALKDALAWSVGKSLGNLDYQFLSASQKLDKRDAEIANKILRDANQKAVRRIRIGSGILVLSLIVAAIAGWQAQYAFTKQREAQIGTRLQRLGDSAWRQFEFEQLDALLSAMQAGQALRDLVQDNRLLQDYPATIPLLALRQILDQIQEKNILEGHKEAVNSVCFSPDGQWIATASSDRTARIWDRQGRTQVVLLHPADVYSVRCSPDGQRLATASQDGTIKLWNWQGQELTSFKAHPESAYSVSFSPDGKMLASASRDGTAKLWTLQGQLLATLRGHQKSVDDVTFSPDGKGVATASRDGTVRLWNLQGQQIEVLQNKGNPVYSVGFSPDGKQIVTASRDGTATVWDRSGKVRLTLKGHQELLNRVSFSPNGQWLVTASSDGTAKLWDRQGKELATFDGHQGPVFDVAFSPNGQEVATASSDGTIKLWDLSPKPTKEFQGSTSEIDSVSFNPTGELVAIATKEGNVYVWDVQGKLKAQFSADSASFSPDGQRLATVAGRGTIIIRDLSGKELAVLQEGAENAGRIYHVAFSADGKWLAAAFQQGKVSIWQVQGDRPGKIKTFQADSDSIYSLSFSPDGRWLATVARGGTAKLWDWQQNRPVTFAGNPSLSDINQVNFSPDGQFFVTAMRDGTAKLWDVQGQLLKELKGDIFAISSISFSADGQRIATGSSDGILRLWDLAGNWRAEFKGHQDSIVGISFSRDRQHITTVARDGTIRVWQVAEGLAQLDHLLQQGCSWLKDYLSTRPQARDKLPVCDRARNS
jgi:WD40 repeat protein